MRPARSVASRLGIANTGTLGVLLSRGQRGICRFEGVARQFTKYKLSNQQIPDRPIVGRCGAARCLLDAWFDATSLAPNCFANPAHYILVARSAALTPEDEVS